MQKLDLSKDKVTIPMGHLPIFRSTVAIQNKVEKNLLFKTWGGIGDQICAEPTLRFALRQFHNCDVNLASEAPELFSHLNFKHVFDLKKERPIWTDYLTFETITPPDESNLVWQFFSHMLTNCVDFPALCALRSQLPKNDREIYLSPYPGSSEELRKYISKPSVFIHAGKHWPSKTFPKDWWDAVIDKLLDAKITPILIGADTDDNRGTVNVNPMMCIDLRNKTTLSETIWLLQRASVLLTNDSSPLHMAASRNPKDIQTGWTWIGYIATCKHPDYITHWRRPSHNCTLEFQWREENLGLGGMWDIVNQCPNQDEKVVVDQIDEETLRTWLPSPESVASWAISKLESRGPSDHYAY